MFFGGTKLISSSHYWTSSSYNSSAYYCISGSGGSLVYYSNSTINPFRQVIGIDELVTSDIPYLFNKFDELTLAVTDGSNRRFLTLEEYQKDGIPSGYEAEGLAVRSKYENFIISLTNEATDEMYYSAAVQLYGDKNFPTVSQCHIIGMRWKWINDALVAFGGTRISTDSTMAIKTDAGKYYYLCSSSGGASYYYIISAAKVIIFF